MTKDYVPTITKAAAKEERIELDNGFEVIEKEEVGDLADDKLRQSSVLAEAEYINYRIRRGDTLFKLSYVFKTTVK